MSNTMKGVVKWFNDAKGFGFIEHSSGKDVFVHYSVIEQNGYKSLKDGEEVLYEINEGTKGLHAIKVQRVNPPAEEAKPAAGQPISYDLPQFAQNANESKSAKTEENSSATSSESSTAQLSR